MHVVEEMTTDENYKYWLSSRINLASTWRQLGRSMIEAKRLQNEPLRAERLLAVHEAADALAERVVINAPRDRFLQQNEKLRSKTRRLPPFENI